MKHKTTIPLILLIGCISCSQQKNSGSAKDAGAPYIINFEQCMETERAMKISEIADTVRYLELKTPKDLVITRIRDIFPIENELIIYTRDGVFKFTQEGEYIRQIGRTGQGPGEHTLVLGIDIDRIRREIVVSDIGKLLFFDLDGNFLRMKKGYFKWIGVSESIVWGSDHAVPVLENIATAINTDGDTVAFIPNPNYGQKSLNDGVRASTPVLHKSYYHYKNGLYMKGTSDNDTIWQLSGKNRTPHAIINKGKYKLPAEYEAWYNWTDFERYGAYYWGTPAATEDDRFIYVLALRFRSIDGNNYTHNDDNYRYVVYDKEKGCGFIAKSDRDSKIKDDILGGPSIWPRWVTDDYYMNVVEWYDLEEMLKNGNYTLAPALEKQFSTFTHGTNQLIILCHKKK